LDGNGEIDRDEFYQLKEQLLGPEVSKIIVRRIVDGSFSNVAGDDNSISEAEFVQACRSILDKTNVDRSSTSNMSLHDAFDRFAKATTLEGVIQHFAELKELSPDPSRPFYDVLREDTCRDVHLKLLWSLLEKKRAEQPYDAPWVKKKAKVLVVGAGPAGLRAAIDLALLGAQVTLLEGRRAYSRHNLLHLWDSSIRDLKNIGAKFFFGQFCSGGINHVGIKDLQLMLTKVALILGVKIETQTQFVQVDYPKSFIDPSNNEQYWYPILKRQGGDGTTDTSMPFNAICIADGANSRLSEYFGFTHKVLKGGEAIGITTNFVNSRTKEEQLREFGLLACYDQAFFKKLRDDHGIGLENLVYYRGETHYFVMTAKRDSLVETGVAKYNFQDISALLAPNNINHLKLEEFVKKVAASINLPATCPFAPNAKGNNDIAIFDFSQKKQTTELFQLVGGEGGIGKKLLVCAVGDAAVEPFWPLGTGANRAIHSAADSAWMVRRYFADDPPSAEELQKEMGEWYKILASSGPEDLNSNYGQHTIDPSTRYKKRVVF